MVVRIDPKDEAATVLSLPRDLIVPIAGSGEERRINEAYSTGTPDQGRQALIDTISQNFGIDINHYVEIDFQGFSKMVDAVGGVPMYIDPAVRDRHTGLYQVDLGCQTLSGDEALQFVRSRHLEYMTPELEWESDPTGDLGRITRQQVFMREALAKVMDEADNPVHARELVGIGVDTVGVDGDMGIRDILDLADRFRDFDPAQLKTYSLPILPNDDGATVTMDDGAAQPILQLFRGEQEAEAPADVPDVAPDLVHVQVLNGSGVSGQATDAADALGVAGFDVVGTGNATGTIPWAQTTVLYRAGDEQYAQRLARQVAGGAAYEVSDDVGDGQVALVTGSDFTAISTDPAPADTVAPPGAGSSTATTAAPASGEGSGGTAPAAPAEPAAPAPTPTVGYSTGAPPAGTVCE